MDDLTTFATHLRALTIQPNPLRAHQLLKWFDNGGFDVLRTQTSQTLAQMLADDPAITFTSKRGTRQVDIAATDTLADAVRKVEEAFGVILDHQPTYFPDLPIPLEAYPHRNFLEEWANHFPIATRTTTPVQVIFA